jgi:hypothetical protein
MRGYLIASCLVLAVFTLFSATQAQADTIDNFTYQAGENTFAWQLPSSPTILAGNFSPGLGFSIPMVAYSENGIPQDPADLGFFSLSGGGGFILGDIIQGTGPILAFGSQIYSDPEYAPTFLTGTFPLFDFGNAVDSILTIAPVPEPSTLMLLGTGMVVLLGFALKKAIV